MVIPRYITLLNHHHAGWQDSLEWVAAFPWNGWQLSSGIGGNLPLEYTELEYLCRMRGIECRQLSDAHILEEGLLINRTKGSRDNIVLWNPRLRHAIDEALRMRTEIWERKKCPVPVKTQDRAVIVNNMGDLVRESAYHSAWQRFIRHALESDVITEDERFSLHDLKRKGVTDTPGVNTTQNPPLFAAD